MRSVSTSSGTSSNQQLTSARSRPGSAERGSGSQGRLDSRESSLPVAGGAGPSPLAARQAGASGEPSSKTSDDDAGESPEKEGGRRQKLTAKQAQELEALFQADPSGPAARRAALSEQFGLPQQQIANWFQNRRAREQNKELHQDFETVQKCLRAAFQENQMLRKQLEELRAVHALCPPRGSVKPDPEPPRVSFPPRFGKMTWQGPAFGSSPHLFPPPTASPPLKRPPRSISEPALPKRARIGSPPEATAVSGPSFRSQAPVGKRTLDGFGNDFRLAGEPTLRQLEQARAPLLLASAPPPTMTKPLGALTLDEAFRDLLGADQLTSGSFDATPGGSGDPFGPFAGGVGSPFDLGGLPSVEPGSDAPSTAPGIEGELAPYADASRDLPEEDPAEMPPWWED